MKRPYPSLIPHFLFFSSYWQSTFFDLPHCQLLGFVSTGVTILLRYNLTLGMERTYKRKELTKSNVTAWNQPILKFNGQIIQWLNKWPKRNYSPILFTAYLHADSMKLICLTLTWNQMKKKWSRVKSKFTWAYWIIILKKSLISVIYKHESSGAWNWHRNCLRQWSVICAVIVEGLLKPHENISAEIMLHMVFTEEGSTPEA